MEGGEGMEEEEERGGLEDLEDVEDLEDMEEWEYLEDQQETSLSFPLGRHLLLTVHRAWPRQPRRR